MYGGPPPVMKSTLGGGEKSALNSRLENMLGGGLMLPGSAPPARRTESDGDGPKLVHLTKDRPLTPKARRRSSRMNRPRSMTVGTPPLLTSLSAPETRQRRPSVLAVALGEAPAEEEKKDEETKDQAGNGEDAKSENAEGESGKDGEVQEDAAGKGDQDGADGDDDGEGKGGE